ncbi:MAG: hypothetical protein WC521_07740 [Bdellovibrionales bacterium]|jgi:hypothetical protein
MRNFVFLSVFGVFALGGCTPQIVAGEAAATIYLTHPEKGPPADTKHQIQEHESWCYKTMADVECYAKAQDMEPNRLVNVEPQNLRPLTADAYKDEIAGRRPSPATEKPVELGPSKENIAEKGNSAERPNLIERKIGYRLPFLHIKAYTPTPLGQ